jgi:AcrR family transcriptional regulator
MLDQSTAKGRIIAAAMRLAAERPWREVSLLDIAAGAHVSLAELRREVGGKGAILAAFVRAIEDEVLAAPVETVSGAAPRDALFEVVMARLDALAPYKSALRSILAESGGDPLLLPTLVESQTWMLTAAGIGADGVLGPVKVIGLASVYSGVLTTWLDDDDPGLARTMATLDRRLRRGERGIQTLDEMARAARRLADILLGGGRAREARPEPPAAGPSTSAPDPQAAPPG